MELLRDQMTMLVGEGLYDSAEMLGCFLMSATTSSNDLPPNMKAENLILFADAVYGRKEYRRALNLYRQALQHCKAVPKQNATGARASVSAGSRIPSLSNAHIMTVNESELKYKIGLCHLAVNDPRSALSEMEQIPSKSRTLRINVTLAKLYRTTGYDRAATLSYRECLRQCPYLLEAVVALAELGVAAKELHPFFPQVQSKSYRGLADHFEPVRWLQGRLTLLPPDLVKRVWELILATSFVDTFPRFNKIGSRMGIAVPCPMTTKPGSTAIHRKCLEELKGSGGLEQFSYLGQRFPNNVHVLVETAKAEAALGRIDEALHNFEKARQADHYNVSGMDEYAMLLRARGRQVELNRLVHELLNIDSTRAEVWVASSVYWEMQDDKIRALSYAEKSILPDFTQATVCNVGFSLVSYDGSQSMAVEERHTTAYLVKGSLSLSLNRSEAAVMAFRKAQSLRADLRAYQGLVRAYLAIPKHKEALCVAREAMKAMPHSAKALTLVGDVYAQNPDGREKGRKFYESALRLEPGCLGAVLALADLNAAEGRNEQAVNLLQRYLKNWADDSLHSKLAQILALSNKLGESLSHYQTALSLNPANEAAKKGLERLEKQMKGVDPDTLEEEEDNEGEDADGDEEGEFQ